MDALLQALKNAPESVEFPQVMAVIAERYDYQAATFYNGLDNDTLKNDAGTNEGSCKIFAFAKLNQLSEQETLACFGQYYRNDVLAHPENNDHQNIRHFMKFGWSGIQFENFPLTAKA
ncbi:type III effector [Photobacterium leiognathi subsp. mandapamensis]|uniref:HopJ type III effector protein n=1 Tax=Photobacterium leiognathi TaxID=553611 RepID=UPI000D16A781|nr:HopJ type III effector protein [Photobacterium leiognathi]PSW64922.1 type III effector [Photobacterium leiognathi subsp. mandapamensis]